MHPTPLHEILYRVERRELQVDVAAERIRALFLNDAEELEATDPDQLEIALAPVGVLTTYNAMETKQAKSTEDLPPSPDQLREEQEAVRREMEEYEARLLREMEEQEELEFEDELVDQDEMAAFFDEADSAIDLPEGDEDDLEDLL